MLFNKSGGQFKQTNITENPALAQAARTTFFGGENKNPVQSPIKSPVVTISSNQKGNLV